MKLKFLVMALIPALVLTACQLLPGSSKDLLSKDQSAYEKIQNALIAMKTYKSEASVEYISNKGRNKYETLQHCKITGQYRIEVTGPENVSGNITLSDGQTIYQYNTRIPAQISIQSQENPERSELFVTSFIRNYFKSEEVSISVGNFGEGKCTVLESVIPGAHPYLASEKLWVDNTTLKPVKLVIYDPGGAERIVVTYNTFEYNIEMDDNLFKYSR